MERNLESKLKIMPNELYVSYMARRLQDEGLIDNATFEYSDSCSDSGQTNHVLPIYRTIKREDFGENHCAVPQLSEKKLKLMDLFIYQNLEDGLNSVIKRNHLQNAPLKELILLDKGPLLRTDGCDNEIVFLDNGNVSYRTKPQFGGPLLKYGTDAIIENPSNLIEDLIEYVRNPLSVLGGAKVEYDKYHLMSDLLKER